MSDLEGALLAAHAADNQTALVSLYKAAADAVKDTSAEGFFLTQAYVFALESNHPDSRHLHNRLKALGRET